MEKKANLVFSTGKFPEKTEFQSKIPKWNFQRENMPSIDSLLSQSFGLVFTPVELSIEMEHAHPMETINFHSGFDIRLIYYNFRRNGKESWCQNAELVGRRFGLLTYRDIVHHFQNILEDKCK